MTTPYFVFLGRNTRCWTKKINALCAFKIDGKRRTGRHTPILTFIRTLCSTIKVQGFFISFLPKSSMVATLIKGRRLEKEMRRHRKDSEEILLLNEKGVFAMKEHHSREG